MGGEDMMNVWIKTILSQFFVKATHNPNHQELSFSPKCIQLMKDWQLSEADVLDVFRNGEGIGDNKMVRKYNGYEIGMYYAQDKKTGNYIATFVWKRDRR
jgi:hypothetical protein